MPQTIRYWQAARAPRYSLLFALPLLLLYELLAFVLSHDAIAGVRNGADVLLKSVFVALGGRNGVLIFGVLLVGTGAVLAYRDWRRAGRELSWRVFPGMMAESVFYAVIFGFVTASITSIVLHGTLYVAAGATQGGMTQLDLPTQLMVSLGAGIYEELLFRVLLVAGLAKLGAMLGWRPLVAGIFAAIIGALIFSAFHYIGPYGDPFEISSFTFRTIAGILFSALYLIRGFGIAAWTHALYDIFLTLR
ncbi:MAG: CPBP family intramembrane glutamic endopeptidase [Gemmatimonadota bacterium]